MGWLKKHTAFYTLAMHSMDKILQAFDSETGQAHKDEQGKLKVQVVVDWPISGGKLGDEEYNRFFEWAKHLNTYHPEKKDVTFQLKGYYPLRYQTKTYDGRMSGLSVFCQQERQFLESYLWLRQLPEFFKLKELFSVMKDNQAQEQAEKILMGFEIEKGKIRCTDDIPLQALVPYVKRLLQLFPEIEDNTKRALSSDGVRNRVYQIETRRYVERISHSPLDIKPDALILREFIEDEQQQVLQLQMNDGDEWTGLIKVYQVLQKTGCLIEGQYTILKLKRFLTINRLMNFTTLMQSTETPQLLLMACEDNQLLDEQIKDIFIILFQTIKEKPLIKIILTTRSEGNNFRFLQQIGRNIFRKGFVARDEQLTWSDITNRSREMLLNKSVKFQSAKIYLHELMSAESAAANFLPLGALLEEKELTIADPVPTSNGYNKSYYIGRTFNRRILIKQGIFSDKSAKELKVYLANTEQEFHQLCQLYPNSNVHWLEKNKSGKLVWKESQGSLELLRKYIDTKISHTYTADDLDKLLEKAQHQRVMLISDTAGMGKSTVLTHLSKEIKQKFPAKWVVRIDLNDHTDALYALKQEQVDKEKAIEFVSEKLLKLKPGLEMELFKQCCEQKQKIRIVIMLDGFDEISPFYKDIFIDFLQALRQTAVEQMWVTTRPHLREELEDKLQRLSYTLEPFSKENQVEFLKKVWSLQDWFSEPEVKEAEIGKSRLEIYAEHLVKELAQSISDTDRKLTGIPLQILMLAEAFDEEVKTFCQSAKSMPQLEFKLDLLGLYGRFIERKYDIYQEEKFQVPVSNVVAIEQRKRDLKSLREDYQLQALKVLFTEEQVALFQNNNQCTFSVEQLTRIGIVQVSHDGKPHFIHRTFAEYYVADFLVNRLTEGNNISQQVETFILKDIFLEDDYRGIRVFVNGLMWIYKPSKEMLKQHGSWIYDFGNDCLLHKAALEGNANIIEFLLHSARAGGHKGTESMLLIGKDARKRTAWHMAAERGEVDVLQKIWDTAKHNLTNEEIQIKLLLATDSDRNTAWQKAAESGELDVLQRIWDWAKETLTTEEINNKILLATDLDGNTAWYRAAELGKLDVLQKVWDWAKDNLTKEERKNKLLLATDSEGKTAWHRAAMTGKQDVLQKIWELVKDSLTTEEIKNKLLLKTDSYGNTAWHLEAFWGEPDILQKVWELAKDSLTTEEIKNKVLLVTDSTGNTAWHVAALGMKPEVLQKIWELAKDHLTTEEIKNKLLLATDSEGKTAWHRVAMMRTQDVLQKIWEMAKESLTKEEIKSKLLLTTDIYGNTAWQEAACQGNLNLFQQILDWAKDKLTTDEIKNMLLLATDSKGNAAWQTAAIWGKPDVLQKIRDSAKHSLTTEEISNKLLLTTHGDGNTAWHRAAEGGKLDLLQKIWDLAKDILSTEEIKYKLLLATDRDGNTAWQRAAEGGKLDVLQKIWDLANDSLTTEVIKNQLLLATDNNGNTAWQKAAFWKNLELFRKILDWAKVNLTIKEIRNMLLLATDREGNTAWQMAAFKDNLDLFQKIVLWAKDKPNNRRD
jgi:ankyrin repeat protein